MATSDQVPVSQAASDRLQSRSKKPLFLRTGFLLKVLPLIGAAVVFLYQAWEAHEAQWHSVLSDSHWNDSQDAIRVSYELGSFLSTNHRNEARSLIADALPAIQDESDFDTVFFGLLHDTTQSDVYQLLAIDRRLTRRLREIYEVSLRGNAAAAADDKSFRNFVVNPDKFFDSAHPDQVPLLTEASVRVDELDSVSAGLSSLWNGQVVVQRHRRWGGAVDSAKQSPDGQDLRNLVFYNGDFQRISFLNALEVSDVHFYGSCKVDKTKIPASMVSECDDD